MGRLADLTTVKRNVILYGMKKINDWLAEIEEKREKLKKLGGLNAVSRKNLDEWYRIELTYTSNAIEGNTLSRAETALVVNDNLTVAGKSIREHVEAVNHASAWEWVREQVLKKQSVNSQKLLELHQIILQKIDDMDAGKYRNVPVRIAGSRVILPNPVKVPKLMEEFFAWLKSGKDNPIERASEAHLRLVTIHPFADGNGRTARLLMNWLLLLETYPPIVIEKEERGEYLASLEQVQLGGSRERYDKLIFSALSRSYDVYLEAAGMVKQLPKLMKIGELARAAGESVPTIRHWVRMGLLPVAGESKGGYQLFTGEQIERVKRVRELQKMRRLSLEEIGRELN